MFISLFNSSRSEFSINELISIEDKDVFLLQVKNKEILNKDTATLVLDDSEIVRSLALKTGSNFICLDENDRLQLCAQIEKFEGIIL